jgi:endonuclease III
MALLPKNRVPELFDRLAAKWPDAHCELIYNNPFQLLLAVVLSAQATDKSVNKALDAIRLSVPLFGASELVQWGEAGVLERIKSINFAPTKARNVVALSKKILEIHKGEVPSAREALEALPGVGRKTANVVLNVLFGEPTFAVDTHVARLACRMGLVKQTEDRLLIERTLERLVPLRHAAIAHHQMIFHGRYLCQARSPQCSACPIEDLCPKNGVLSSERKKT